MFFCLQISSTFCFDSIFSFFLDFKSSNKNQTEKSESIGKQELSEDGISFSSPEKDLSQLQNLASNADRLNDVKQLQAMANGRNILQRYEASDVKDQRKLGENQNLTDNYDAWDVQRKWVNPVDQIFTADFLAKHKKKFDDKGAARWDTPSVFENTGKNWDFGKMDGELGKEQGAKFFGKLDSQEAIANDAQQKEGLFTLTEKLSVPPKYWINKEVIEKKNRIENKQIETGENEGNPSNLMYLTKIPNPETLRQKLVQRSELSDHEEYLRLPSGIELGAIKEEFKIGGKTKGGEDEIVGLPLVKKVFNDLLGDEIFADKYEFPRTDPDVSGGATGGQDVTNAKKFDNMKATFGKQKNQA